MSMAWSCAAYQGKTPIEVNRIKGCRIIPQINNNTFWATFCPVLCRCTSEKMVQEAFPQCNPLEKGRLKMSCKEILDWGGAVSLGVVARPPAHIRLKVEDVHSTLVSSNGEECCWMLCLNFLGAISRCAGRLVLRPFLGLLPFCPLLSPPQGSEEQDQNFAL